MALNVVLYSDQLLPEVIVEYKRKSYSISRLKVLHVEELTSSELKKAACCNLGESFETNASVDVNMTDAVSGAKKIQMLGLEGVYRIGRKHPISTWNRKFFWIGPFRNVGQVYSDYEGAGNVVNGYESMAGLINLEIEKPEKMDRLFLNTIKTDMEEVN